LQTFSRKVARTILLAEYNGGLRLWFSITTQDQNADVVNGWSRVFDATKNENNLSTARIMLVISCDEKQRIRANVIIQKSQPIILIPHFGTFSSFRFSRDVDL
jgi:hypothetical protein